MLNCTFAAEEFLNQNNFDRLTKEYKIAVVNFFADWCHFCREFAPAYHDASVELEPLKLSKSALIAKVDCVDQNELCAKYGVNKYPTIKLFREGFIQKKEYRGSRTKDAVVDYVKKQLEDTFSIVSNAPSDLNAIKTNYNEAHVLGVFSSLDDTNAEFAMFKKVASSLSETCKFFAASGYHDQGLFFRHHDDWQDVPKPLKPMSIALMNDKDAVTAVQDLCKPKVRELTFDNAEEITEEGLPLFILFYKPGDKKSRIDFTNHIISHFNHEARVNFVTASGETFSHPLAHLSLTSNDLPAVVIDSFQHMYKMKHTFADALKDPNHFKKFIEDLQSGRLHILYHYPEQDDEPQNQKQDSGPSTPPPRSVFKNLQPNRDRYSMQHDEF